MSSSKKSNKSRPIAAGESSMRASMAEVEALLGYKFLDPSLLEAALTHSSDTHHASYQRLEFVGDAALALAVSNHFYLTNPDLGPGYLTLLRIANTSTEKLARVAVRHRLYRLIRRNSPQLDDRVEKFTRAVENNLEEEMCGMPYGGSTMKAPKVLADIVESISAAVYVDCNFDPVRLWTVVRGLLEPIITAQNLDKHPVTILHEFCLKKGRSYHFENPKEGDVNHMSVFVDGKLLGIGSSENQLIAKLNAARDALAKLGGSVGEDVEMADVQTGGGDGSSSSKHRLDVMCTKNRWSKPVYRTEKEEGPAHDKKFVCSVQVVISNTEYTAVGELMPRIKDSENSAATKLLYELSNR